MTREKRIPDKVDDAIGDHAEIQLISKNPGGEFYPCEPEKVRNGVILYNPYITRVFKNAEMWEIITGEHENWETDIDPAEGI